MQIPHVPLDVYTCIQGTKMLMTKLQKHKATSHRYLWVQSDCAGKVVTGKNQFDAIIATSRAEPVIDNDGVLHAQPHDAVHALKLIIAHYDRQGNALRQTRPQADLQHCQQPFKLLHTSNTWSDSDSGSCLNAS